MRSCTSPSALPAPGRQFPFRHFNGSLMGGPNEVYVSPQIRGSPRVLPGRVESNPVLWFRQLHPDTSISGTRIRARLQHRGPSAPMPLQSSARDGIGGPWCPGRGAAIRDAGRPVAVAWGSLRHHREQLARKASRLRCARMSSSSRRSTTGSRPSYHPSILRLQRRASRSPEAKQLLPREQDLGPIHACWPRGCSTARKISPVSDSRVCHAAWLHHLLRSYGSTFGGKHPATSDDAC